MTALACRSGSRQPVKPNVETGRWTNNDDVSGSPPRFCFTTFFTYYLALLPVVWTATGDFTDMNCMLFYSVFYCRCFVVRFVKQRTNAVAQDIWNVAVACVGSDMTSVAFGWAQVACSAVWSWHSVILQSSSRYIARRSFFIVGEQRLETPFIHHWHKEWFCWVSSYL
jgi:hypothetical protein